MDSILEKIIAYKKTEVEQQKKLVPLNTLLLQKRKRSYYSLKERLSEPQSSGIIAEFKRRSPSKNWINQKASAPEIVKAYENAGAAGLSILTDTHFFGGSMNDLILAAPLVESPVLRKDFIIDEYQLVEAEKNGADVILLIAACLLPEQVLHLAKAAKALQLEVLLEIHHQQELKYITEEVDLVGINNRNLHTFATSLETSAELSPFVPDRCLKISESGISSALDINYLRHFGFKGFLMGEQFMKSPQPGLALKQFINEIS